jgi:2-dehydropantoate 2-reductase
MNIVVFGAGAIGSLFGALLAKQNNVTLVGRAAHTAQIKQHGLIIEGKTRLSTSIAAVESIDDISVPPDLILLTVKSYDTETASRQLRPLLKGQTLVLSLQNGLTNLEKIKHHLGKEHLLAGVTTHGAFFTKPGLITHTGKGNTILGELDGHPSNRLEALVSLFNRAGIQTQMSTEINTEIWKKAIVNSSINPITAFLKCKNGYLLENPILEKTVESICSESCRIASTEHVLVSPLEMMEITKEVIHDTAENYSSMLQSIQQGKRTEIDSINGELLRIGMKNKTNTSLNRILVELIISISPS